MGEAASSRDDILQTLVFIHTEPLSRSLLSAGGSIQVEARRLLKDVDSETLGRIENFLPASKAEVRLGDAKLQAKDAKLEAEVTDLKAENAETQALLNHVIEQVNKLTPVSASSTVPKCPTTPMGYRLGAW